MKKKDKDFLYRQLINLGDMMGDGLHHEPDGKWIEKEYKRTAKALGLWPKKKKNVKGINAAMAQRVVDVACLKCGGRLRQTRSGSKRARCVNCSALYQLLK